MPTSRMPLSTDKHLPTRYGRLYGLIHSNR